MQSSFIFNRNAVYKIAQTGNYQLKNFIFDCFKYLLNYKNCRFWVDSLNEKL